MTGSPALVDFAQRVGPHALTAFLLLLGASTLAGGAVCLAFRRRKNSADDQKKPQPGRIVLGFSAGFGGIVLAAGLFAWIAWHVETGRTLGLADQALADAIALHVPLAVLALFAGATHFGDPIVLVAIAAGVAALLWRLGQRGLMLGWLMALAGNAVLNPSLKQIFERVRPLHDHGLAVATGFSFPSGHSSGAMVAYGMLAYVVLRLAPPRWHVVAVMAAVAVVLTTACSRVFLRVHFASDVAAGLLSGGLWLTVCVASLEYARRRFARSAGASVSGSRN
jgi:membrane-associated phospholipid phosphatase